MRCPSLAELPPPPPGKTGWPWTEESPRLPDVMSDGAPWPRMSVTTPCRNAAPFIEETLRSVLLQGYPDLEYIVVDGASTDGTVELLRKYGAWLSRWVSEDDRGPAHAVNKAWAWASHGLLSVLPADDLYLPGALHACAVAHARSPRHLVFANVEDFIDGTTTAWVDPQRNITFENFITRPFDRVSWYFDTQGLFVPREILDAAGPLDESLRYSCDFDWLCRLTQIATSVYVPATIARFRVHPGSTSVHHRLGQVAEVIETVQRYWDAIPGLDKTKMLAHFRLHEAAVCLAQHPYSGSVLEPTCRSPQPARRGPCVSGDRVRSTFS